MIDHFDPQGWHKTCIRQSKTFLNPVPHLRPAEAHLARQAQSARQSIGPPIRQEPDPAKHDEQNHPALKWKNQLENEQKNAQLWEQARMETYLRAGR